MRSLSRGLPSLRSSAFQLQGCLRWQFSLLLFLSISTILPGWEYAADVSSAAPVELGVEFGFHGYYAPGYLAPVRVRLLNQGATFAGELIISQSAETLQGQTRTVQVVQELQVPKGARQRYELEFPIFGQREFIISEGRLQLVLQVGGRALVQQTISLHDYDYTFDRLNLLLSEAPAPTKLPSGQPLLPVDLQELPSRWAGYQGVRRLYLGRFNLGSLSGAQRQALREWLSSGGELVVLLGSNWYFQQDRTLEELLPFAPRDMQLAQIDSISQQVTLGQAQGTILASTDSGLPLLIRGHFGRGTVYAITVDLFALTDGPQEQALWQGLNSAPDDEVLTPDLGAELFDNLKLEQPSRPILAGLLTLYLLGFALLGMMTLHTRRLWGTIPLWVGLTSVGLLLYLQQPVFTHPLRSLEVGRIWVRGDQAFIQDWYSAFARRGAALRLQIDGQAIVNQVKSTHDLTINTTLGHENLQLALAAQEARHLQLVRPIPFPVQFDVRRAGPDMSGLRIDVYNETDQELARAVLWWQGQFYTVGTVAAHEHVGRALADPLGELRPTGVYGGSEIETSIQRRLWAAAESERPAEPTLWAWVRQERFAPVSGEYRTVLQLVSVTGR